VATPLRTQLLVPVQDISIAPEIALRGVYDEPFVDFLARSLRPGMTFVDVGANVGLFTIVASALVGVGGRVFAYECNPGMVECLRSNIRMNWFNDRVVLVPKAAGRDGSPTRFWMSDRVAGLGSTQAGDASNPKDGDVIELEVPTESLDEGLDDVQFVDLLKIDVEGGEAAVLDGARQLLTSQKIGMLSLEFRGDVLTDAAYAEMTEHLVDLQHRGATFHVPGSRRAIPLDEVLVISHFPQLICRFPNATIVPS
jgi:FkbM family methyltransferase